MITFPDGILHSIYLAGQLTVFRNVPYFRKQWVSVSFKTKITNTASPLFNQLVGMSMGYLICEPGKNYTVRGLYHHQWYR